MCIKDLDVALSTALQNTCSGDESYKRCMWCLLGQDGECRSVYECLGVGVAVTGVECGVSGA